MAGEVHHVVAGGCVQNIQPRGRYGRYRGRAHACGFQWQPADQAQQPGCGRLGLHFDALEGEGAGLVAAHFADLHALARQQAAREVTQRCGQLRAGRVAVKQRPGVFARRQHLHPHTHLPQVLGRPDQALVLAEQRLAEQLDGQADRVVGAAQAVCRCSLASEGASRGASGGLVGGLWRQIAALAVLPQPATKVAHGPCTGIELRCAGVHKPREPTAHRRAALWGHGFVRRNPAVGGAAHVQADARTVRLGGHQCAALAGRQLARIKAAHQVNEAARVRVVANRRAHRGPVGVLHRAARHLHRLLRFLRVVKVDGCVGQQQRCQRRHALAQVAGVEQRQLARGVAQPRHDLGLAAHKAVLVGLPGALLFVLEHHHAQRHRGQGQQHKHAAHQDAQAECGQAQAGHFQA